LDIAYWILNVQCPNPNAKFNSYHRKNNLFGSIAIIECMEKSDQIEHFCFT
jgi:hypothetical protein